jgi:hypothetical protein
MSPFSKPFSYVVPTCDTFTTEEWSALQRLRARYQQSADLLTEREVAHLRFLQWLAQTGRLAEDSSPEAADVDAKATAR